MGLEASIASIADLNALWPLDSESVAQGDNHIRNIKDAVKKTFPNINAPLTLTDEEINALIKQTNPVDATAGRLLTVGAFGLGTDAPTDIAAGSLNDATRSGYYAVVTPANVTEEPKAAGSGVLHVQAYGLNNTVQTYTEVAGSKRTWQRIKDAGIWGEWHRVHSNASLIGTVALAAGVPTGEVFQSGSNANGNFTKFADGTMVCDFSTAVLTTDTVAFSPIYFNGTLGSATFPAAFSVAPQIAPRAILDAVTAAQWPGAIVVSATGISSAYLLSAGNGAKGKIAGLAFGRWA